MCEPVTTTIAAIGTVAGIQQGRQARKESKKAARVQRRISERETQRQRMMQLRESQMARAQVIAQGAQTGTLGASGLQGGVASIGTQAAGNIGFLNQIESLQQQAARSRQKASDFAGNVSNIGALTQFGTKVLQDY
jgi:hypothetical protein